MAVHQAVGEIFDRNFAIALQVGKQKFHFYEKHIIKYVLV